MLIKRLRIDKVNDSVQVTLGNDVLDLYYDDINSLFVWLRDTLPLLKDADRLRKQAEIEALRIDIQNKQQRIVELESVVKGR